MVQYCDLHECEIDRRGCPWCLIESLEQQLQQARKDGWEQCKAEMMLWIRNNGCGDVGLNIALSSMAYKGAQDEQI